METEDVETDHCKSSEQVEKFLSSYIYHYTDRSIPNDAAGNVGFARVGTELQSNSRCLMRAPYLAKNPEIFCGSIPEQYFCPLCQRLMLDAIVLNPCKHEFCASCVQKRVMSRRSPNCPLGKCRKYCVRGEETLPSIEVRKFLWRSLVKCPFSLTFDPSSAGFKPASYRFVPMGATNPSVSTGDVENQEQDDQSSTGLEPASHRFVPMGAIPSISNDDVENQEQDDQSSTGLGPGAHRLLPTGATTPSMSNDDVENQEQDDQSSTGLQPGAHRWVPMGAITSVPNGDVENQEQDDQSSPSSNRLVPMGATTSSVSTGDVENQAQDDQSSTGLEPASHRLVPMGAIPSMSTCDVENQEQDDQSSKGLEPESHRSLPMGAMTPSMSTGDVENQEHLQADLVEAHPSSDGDLLVVEARARFCSEVMGLKHLEVHVRTCNYRPVECSFKKDGCKAIVQSLYLELHEISCLFNVSTPLCDTCGFRIGAIDSMGNHLANNCLRPCPYKTSGCRSRMDSGDLDEHVATCPFSKVVPPPVLDDLGARPESDPDATAPYNASGCPSRITDCRGNHDDHVATCPSGGEVATCPSGGEVVPPPVLDDDVGGAPESDDGTGTDSTLSQGDEPVQKPSGSPLPRNLSTPIRTDKVRGCKAESKDIGRWWGPWIRRGGDRRPITNNSRAINWYSLIKCPCGEILVRK